MKVQKAKIDPDSAPTKLKDLKLTSVDFCQQGANPDAFIRLAKSKDGTQPQDTRPAFERAVDLLKSAFHVEPESPDVKKDAQTFADIKNNQDAREKLWQCNDAFDSSIRSILQDNEMEDSAKHELMLQSLSQFTEAMTANIDGLYTAAPDGVSKEKGDENTMDEKEFDLSGMTADEQNTFKALLTKSMPKEPAATDNGGVPSEEGEPSEAEKKKGGGAKATASTAAKKQVTDFLNDRYPTTTQPQAETKKSVEEVLPPAVQAAIDRMNGLSDKLEKSLKQQDDNAELQVAKKYEVLGDTAEIAKALGQARAAGESAYNAYVSAMDKALEVTKKSDSLLFGEVGKSASGGASTVVGKAEDIAKSIRDKDPKLTIQQSMAKAFEQHPELEAEYEKNYEGGKA